MWHVTIRHFTADDIPIRSGLLREPHFQANLVDYATSTQDDALVERQRRAITGELAGMRIFTMCGPKGEVLGFAWISSIDGRSQSCELSFAVLPRYRGGLGAAGVSAAQKFVYAELNMRVLIHQVLEHNTMLQSAERVAGARQVRSGYDSYTVGSWRTAAYWTETADEALASARAAADRRAERAERIQARSRADA